MILFFHKGSKRCWRVAHRLNGRKGSMRTPKTDYQLRKKRVGVTFIYCWKIRPVWYKNALYTSGAIWTKLKHSQSENNELTSGDFATDDLCLKPYTSCSGVYGRFRQQSSTWKEIPMLGMLKTFRLYMSLRTSWRYSWQPAGRSLIWEYDVHANMRYALQTFVQENSTVHKTPISRNHWRYRKKTIWTPLTLSALSNLKHIHK